MRRIRQVGAWLLAAALIVSCSQAAPSNSPASTGSPASTSGEQPTDTPAQPTASPAATPAPPEPTSTELIRSALQDGTLDYQTALLYRLYAAFGDERLPEGYRGEWAEDPLAVDLVRERYASLPADVQATVLPFLVRPTSPDSYWAPEPEAMAMARPATLAQAACIDGFVSEQANAPAAVKVWGQCGQRAAADVAAEVAEAVFDVEQLWPAMTGLMGTPLGDQNDPSGQIPASPEGGDGLLDIYLVDPTTKPNFYGRNLGNNASGIAYEWWPKIGAATTAATSTYIVIDSRLTGLDLRATIAHELFHSLQARFNRQGTVVQIATPSGDADWAHFWFVEASATWSEHEFVPEANDVGHGPYARFTADFQPTAKSLMQSDYWNEYSSWVWPLFMRQQIGRQAIADAWSEFQGKKHHRQLQAALDLVLPFKPNFREFAVRVLNADLEPGDPLKPRFQVLDTSFPETLPSGPRMSAETLFVGGQQSYQHTLPALWTRYVRLSAARDVQQLEFDFSALTAAATLDAELIYKPRTEQWRRQSILATDAQVTLCDVSEAWLVAANHDQMLNNTAQSSWSVKSLGQPCPKQVTGDLTASFTETWSNPDGSVTVDHGELTIHLVIAFNETGSMYAAKGSTFRVVREGSADSACPSDNSSGGLGPGDHPAAATGPLADPNATGTARIEGGGGEIGLHIDVNVGCGWGQFFGFTEAADGIYRHDYSMPVTQLGPYQTREDESHGTITGL